ncbi:SHOCT domain-containing protein [Candidatus Pelagibacter sp.]|jgi:hypothetical protein|nr:SHOCT domain-containing protein [Candidatus Pelagibacter sp.]
MLKISNALVILFLIFSFTYSIAENYKVDDKVKDQFIFNKKFKIDLPEGEWTIADKSAFEYYGIFAKEYLLLKLEDNKVIEAISIGEMKTEGKYQGAINSALYEILFKNKYDGCYERPEYSVLEFYAKGSSHNCFTVGHQDLVKDIYDPDDPELKTAYSQLKVWLKNRSIELPKIALYSSHSYFSRLAMGKWLTLGYLVDPKVLNAPKIKFLTEESSEYHKYNINNYPEHNKIMKKWISISAERHVNFEKSIKVIKRHLLDLDQYYLAESKSDNQLSNETIDQIKKLNDLYKSGILTKEEFEKAKKKILN